MRVGVLAVRRGAAAAVQSRGASDSPGGGRPVRVGFIGTGDISNLHAAALRKIEGAELRGVWNRPNCPIVRDPAAKAREYGCELFPSAESLVQSPEIDCVFVLTNYESHLQFAKLAMEAGKPVLVEKPAARGVAEIQELIDTSGRTGVPCMPVHNYVYEPSLWRTQELVRSGQYGPITSLHILYNIYHPEDVCARLPGIIRQIGTHHCYLALYLLAGEVPESVSAFRSLIREGDKGTAPQENIAAINIRCRGGALVHLEMSFAADDHSSDAWSYYIKAIGTRGAARYSHNDWIINERTPPKIHSHTYVPYPHTISACDEYFLRQVVAGGAGPLSTLQDALTCQRILDAAERSCDEGVHVRLD
eukprot:TRINITY_DN29633_c0_g1_i1.p1 TRINITY_DN29633_c0_g1~~TRINITY_DN29633_c0_g1_i1.p1  ORF type:complete len:362 (+),score=98.80 TRINITY_DN29633_c0_g1_i1:78-1163(+)